MHSDQVLPYRKTLRLRGLEKRIGYNTREYKARKWQPKIRNDVALAMHGCHGDREEFVRLLGGKGIDVVFRENDEDASMALPSSTTRTGRSITARGSARSSRRMPLNGSSIIRATSRIRMLPYRSTVCKAVSLPIWRVPSNRLSEYSTWRRTVDPQEEALARRLQRKRKKKRRSRGIS